MSVQVPQMDDLSNRAAGMVAVAPVSPRSKWNKLIPIAGTGSGFTAVNETNTPNAIFVLALADTTAATKFSLQVVQVPANCTYMEIASWGDGSSSGTAPVIELYRSSHPNVSAGAGAGVAAAIPAGEEDWARLFSLLGNATTTLSTTINDTKGAAGANRYQMDEGTYQNGLFDVRGARAVVVRNTTIGTLANWNLYCRFF